MAHMVETMAYAGEVPWHGLGVPVDPDLTPEQMMVAAGLDWEVIKTPAVAEFGGEFIDTGRSALIRSSDARVLTVISDDWNPVQNIEAFEFFADFVDAGDMQMHTAGSLRDGNIVWALAKVNDGFTVFGEDRVESYLLFTNPHEYGKCIDVRFTPTRVVCNNTLTLALKGKSDLMVRVNHRSAFDAEFVKKALGAASVKMATYKDAALFLGSKRYNEKSLENYLKEVFPATGKKLEKDVLSLPANKTLEIVETQPGAEYAKGSWWNAFNAVTFMTDHVLGHNADTRLTSSWYGINRQRKTAALEKAVEYAEAA